MYSTEELLNTKNPTKVKSENEKINNDSDLVSYYANVSVSKKDMSNTGSTIIVFILLIICIILIFMYRKIVVKGR